MFLFKSVDPVSVRQAVQQQCQGRRSASNAQKQLFLWEEQQNAPLVRPEPGVMKVPEAEGNATVSL